MWRLMLEFRRDICCYQDNDFSQELHVYFSRTMAGLILHELQQRGFIGRVCVCLTGLSAVQICLLLKMYGTSWRGESNNGNHGLLSTFIHQEWEKMLLAKLQQLISSVPKWLLSVIKIKDDLCHWQTSLCCRGVLQATISKCVCNLTNRIRFISENTENILFVLLSDK